VLVSSDEDVLKLELAGADNDERARKLNKHLRTIEAGLNGDGKKTEPYLVDGRRSQTLARLSHSDGTLQFYTVSLPRTRIRGKLISCMYMYTCTVEDRTSRWLM
jgi:hypothetical protein